MTDDELKNLFDRMREENKAAHTETRLHFDAALENAKSETRLLAESVAHIDQELIRTRTELREEIHRTAAETQAMIKFSHADLDRRLTNLEETVSDLQNRVERLESTH